VKSQTLPDTSVARPVGPASACACASVGKFSSRQNNGPAGNCSIFFSRFADVRNASRHYGTSAKEFMKFFTHFFLIYMEA
jgi:hypothetical protein